MFFCNMLRVIRENDNRNTMFKKITMTPFLPKKTMTLFFIKVKCFSNILDDVIFVIDIGGSTYVEIGSCFQNFFFLV